MDSLKDKRIIVTGASSGIGHSAAKLMARNGAQVFLVARREKQLASLVDDIAESGGTAYYHVADLSDKGDAEQAVETAQKEMGDIDGLFANAGMGGVAATLPDYPEHVFDEVFAVNVKSLFWLAQKLLPAMVARKSGTILAMGSLSSLHGMPSAIAYSASKHAILGVIRTIAAEFAKHNVRANSLLPGLVHTELLERTAGVMADGNVDAGLAAFARIVPQGRLGAASEIAEVAAFLMSESASYINGQSIVVDGGIMSCVANG